MFFVTGGGILALRAVVLLASFSLGGCIRIFAVSSSSTGKTCVFFWSFLRLLRLKSRFFEKFLDFYVCIMDIIRWI